MSSQEYGRLPRASGFVLLCWAFLALLAALTLYDVYTNGDWGAADALRPEVSAEARARQEQACHAATALHEHLVKEGLLASAVPVTSPDCDVRQPLPEGITSWAGVLLVPAAFLFLTLLVRLFMAGSSSATESESGENP